MCAHLIYAEADRNRPPRPWLAGSANRLPIRVKRDVQFTLNFSSS